jgi:decaprenylphospho-beta-D-erythro-pentofuranosid-2-ulose 2-reductase
LKAVVLGATKGIGRAIARVLVERGDRVILLGRDPGELERSARDLEARPSSSIKIESAVCDLAQPEGFEAALDRADAALDGFDTVIVTAGLFGTQSELEQDTDFARRLLVVNFAHTVVFCELVRKRLLKRGGGRLCVVSSVAGDRGRKPVAIYGASKAGLSCYLEALDHTYRARGLYVLCVKPGFVKTGMTAGLKPPPFAGEPNQVALDIVRSLDRGKPLIYTPWIWRYVMLVIRLLPRFVMRRISF